MVYINETTLCEVELTHSTQHKKGEVSKFFSYINRAQKSFPIKDVHKSFRPFMTMFAKNSHQIKGTDEYVICKEFTDSGDIKRLLRPIHIIKREDYCSINISRDNTKLKLIINRFEDCEQEEIELLLRWFSETCEKLTEDINTVFWESKDKKEKSLYCYLYPYQIRITPYSFNDGLCKNIIVEKTEYPNTTLLDLVKLKKESFKFYLTDSMQNVFEYINNQAYYYNG